MKEYIILTPEIGNVGGAQIYVRNKKKYMEEQGFNVIVFYFTQSPVYIQDLKNCGCCVSDISLPPSYYHKKKQNQIILNMLNEISGDNAIIESHTIALSLWGETLANRIHGKNFTFLLQEKFGVYDTCVYQYFDFKLKRKELVGINSDSIHDLMKPYMEIERSNDFTLPAECTNSVENVGYDSSILINDSSFLRVACLGRLEKTYVLESVKAIVRFCKKNPDKKIQLILIGGGDRSKIDEYLNQNNQVNNFQLSVTGYIYPIPSALLNEMDFAMAGSGAAYALRNNGVITLSLNPDGKPLGILGITTDSAQIGEISEKTIDEWIYEVINHSYSIDEMHATEPFYDYKKYFLIHDEYLKGSSQTKEYYNVQKVAIDKYKRLIYLLIGRKNIKRLSKIFC